MQWKILVLRYRNISTSSGPRTATESQLNAIPDAFRVTFADKMRSNTDGRLTVDVTVPPVIDTLTPATAYTATWWPSWADIRADLDTIPWNTYDSIFVLAPYQGDPNGVVGKGIYSPHDTRGATYATLSTAMGLGDCEGDWMTHEFLHGACQFFMGLGYPMPQPSNPKPGDPLQDGVHVGGEYYPELTGTDPVTHQPRCFTAFYRDLMRGQSRPTGNVGIPLAAWDLGTPRNVGALAGRGSSDGAGFAAAFPELLPAWPVAASGRPDARAFAADGGERQHFRGPDGESVILKGNGQGAYAVRPKIWAAVLSGGGLAVLGYPANALHDWSGGKIQDFRGSGGACAVMQAAGRDAFPVLPKIWAAFLSGGGAPVMGYPTNALHDWGEGKIQDFSGTGGSCAVMQGTGRDAFPVLPKIWTAYTQSGGAPSLGHPTNALHDWGAGKIQNFKLNSGWECGVMSATGRNDAFVVKGLLWRHYVSRGGALSYLGYPVVNEYVAEMGGRKYWMQTFAGGKIRIDQQTSVAEDYR